MEGKEEVEVEEEVDVVEEESVVGGHGLAVVVVGSFFSPTSPLLRPRFNMNSYLSGSSYWNRLRNQRRLGQGGLGYTQPSTTNFRRFGTGSQTNGWGLLRNRFPQRPPTNTGGRIANLLPALKWARPPPG